MFCCRGHLGSFRLWCLPRDFRHCDCMVKGLGFRVKGLGFRVRVFGCKVKGLRLGSRI